MTSPGRKKEVKRELDLGRWGSFIKLKIPKRTWKTGGRVSTTLENKWESYTMRLEECSRRKPSAFGAKNRMQQEAVFGFLVLERAGKQKGPKRDSVSGAVRKFADPRKKSLKGG